MMGGVAETWTAHLDAEDRMLMFTELRFCFETLERSGDPEPLETCLREWRVTAEALSDPVVREILTAAPVDCGPVPDPADFIEVGPPS